MKKKDFNMRAYIDIINEDSHEEILDLSEPTVVDNDVEDFEELAGHTEAPEEDLEALAGHNEFANNQNGYHKREGQNFWTIDNDDPYWDTHDMEGSSAFEEAPRHTDKEKTPTLDMDFWMDLFK